jgi:hypothetical protein
MKGLKRVKGRCSLTSSDGRAALPAGRAVTSSLSLNCRSLLPPFAAAIFRVLLVTVLLPLLFTSFPSDPFGGLAEASPSIWGPTLLPLWWYCPPSK